MVRSFTFSTSLSLPKSLIQIQQYLCSERGFLKDFTKGKENKSSSLQYLIVACSFPHIFLCISLIQMQPYVVFDCLSPISLTMECWVFFFFLSCSSTMLYSLHTWGWRSRRSGTWCGYLNVWLRTRSPEFTTALFSYFRSCMTGLKSTCSDYMFACKSRPHWSRLLRLLRGAVVPPALCASFSNKYFSLSN